MVVLHDKEQGITTYEARIPWGRRSCPGRKPRRPGRARPADRRQRLRREHRQHAADAHRPDVRLSPVVDPGLFASMMLVGDEKALQRCGAGVPAQARDSRGAAAVPPPDHWRTSPRQPAAAPPAVFDGTAVGRRLRRAKRLTVLEEIEAQMRTRFPRVDFLEFHHRIHRRMNREVAGLRARPAVVVAAAAAVSKNAEDPVPKASRCGSSGLPMGGWLVRSRPATSRSTRPAPTSPSTALGAASSSVC
jgi:hypothetical protein